jgi:uncharacterized protein (TIGR02145 family)
MRNLIKTLSVVLIITAINGCTLQEDPDPTNSGGAINVIGQTVQEQGVTNAPGTKTTLEEIVDGGETRWETHWVAGTDKIGIFSPEARTTEGGDSQVKNAEFTAQTSAKSSNFTGTMYWGADENHNFYAYYPRNPGFSGELTEVPISLASAQSQSVAGNTDHIGALDYMVAKSLDVAYQGAVNFTFNHVFDMIEFQIKGSGNLTQVSLNGADPLACAGTIDLTQTPEAGAYTVTTSSTSKYVTVTLGSAASLNSTTAISVYMMVLPGAQSENLQIGVKIDGNWKEMSKTQPSGGFVRGKKYVVALNTEGAGWDAPNTFTDSRDGKVYKTVTIGEQVWMTENLAYLPSVVGPGKGSNSTAYYYVYGYDGTDVDAAKATSNYTTYGVLYNWPAAMSGAASSSADPSGVQGICPTGWHLPSGAEWTQLEEYLIANGYNYDGTTTGNKIAKSMANYSGWNTSTVTGAIGNTDYPEYWNKSGFSALPGGYRHFNGTFGYLGTIGYWWSSTEGNSNHAWNRNLGGNNSNVYRGSTNKEGGLSVRCLRD